MKCLILDGIFPKKIRNALTNLNKKTPNTKFDANPLVGVAMTLRTDRQKLDPNVALHSFFA
jgi:hypothetical protein